MIFSRYFDSDRTFLSKKQVKNDTNMNIITWIDIAHIIALEHKILVIISIQYFKSKYFLQYLQVLFSNLRDAFLD